MCYVHNIFTTNYRLLLVLIKTLSRTLLFCPPITATNNLSPIICYKSIVKMLWTQHFSSNICLLYYFARCKSHTKVYILLFCQVIHSFVKLKHLDPSHYVSTNLIIIRLLNICIYNQSYCRIKILSQFRLSFFNSITYTIQMHTLCYKQL